MHLKRANEERLGVAEAVWIGGWLQSTSRQFQCTCAMLTQATAYISNIHGAESTANVKKYYGVIRQVLNGCQAVRCVGM